LQLKQFRQKKGEEAKNLTRWKELSGSSLSLPISLNISLLLTTKYSFPGKNNTVTFL
jgi:hypothetical protein